MSVTLKTLYGSPVIYKGTIVDAVSQDVVIKASPLPTANFYFTCKVKTAAGLERAGITSNYSKTTGIVTISAAALIAGDTFVIEGVWTTK